MIVPVLAAAMLLVAAQAETAASTSEAPKNQNAPKASVAKTQKAKAEQTEKLICRREATVGSSIERRVCKTQAELDEEEAAAKTFNSEVAERQRQAALLGNTNH